MFSRRVALGAVAAGSAAALLLARERTQCASLPSREGSSKLVRDALNSDVLGNNHVGGKTPDGQA